MYITTDQLKPLCPQRLIDGALDDAGDGDVSALLSALISSAERRVHARLGTSWPPPLPDPVPSVVTDAVAVIAVYELYARNGFKSVDNPRSDDAKAALEALKPFADGTADLYPSASADAEDEAEASVVSEPNALDSQYPMV